MRLTKLFLAVCLLMIQGTKLPAQQYWAMAVMENDKTQPQIIEYHSLVEQAENGTEYYRIYDDGYRFSHDTYNPIKTQYGYRITDKQIYIYDFNSRKEFLAFDFNLNTGSHFTTLNGIEWEVESVKDTLVNISFCGKGESVSKKLLKVKSIDGKVSDQWLEDYGSFINHFMINKLDNYKWSQTLWMEYKTGEYFTREINSDPFYTHDSGWMEGTHSPKSGDNSIKCHYEDGKLVIESIPLSWEHRDYSCFYRDGDNFYNIYTWELEPHVDSGEYALRKDVFSFSGLPSPKEGNYIIHIGDNEYVTGINQIYSNNDSAGSVYDIQGRRLSTPPTNGIYIKNGKKIIGSNNNK